MTEKKLHLPFFVIFNSFSISFLPNDLRTSISLDVRICSRLKLDSYCWRPMFSSHVFTFSCKDERNSRKNVLSYECRQNRRIGKTMYVYLSLFTKMSTKLLLLYHNGIRTGTVKCTSKVNYYITPSKCNHVLSSVRLVSNSRFALTLFLAQNNRKSLIVGQFLLNLLKQFGQDGLR